MCFTCSCKHWSSHSYQILIKLFSTVHQTFIQTLIFIELLVGTFFLLIQNFRLKLQISFKRVSPVLIEFLVGAFFFLIQFFHQSYKSHSRESGLYWVSSGCFLLRIQNFPPKLHNLIQESLVLVEHLMGAFFCWYKTFHQSYTCHSRESVLCWASGGCFLLLIQSFFQPRYKTHSSSSVSVSVFSLSLSLGLSLFPILSFLEGSSTFHFFEVWWGLSL